MKTTEYRISNEKLISRIPGLFAYIDEEDGKVHKATDSEMGCYGKYVENITLNFNFYLPFDETSDDEKNNTILLEVGKTYTYRTLIDYYYQYRDTSFTVNNTDIQFKDYNGNPQTFEEDVLSKTFYANDSDFIKFMERGIGKRKVEFEGIENCPLVPEYVYISSARQKYLEMKSIEKLCKLYETEYNNGVHEFDKKMCCTCDQFNKTGGVEFIKLLEDFIKESETIAEEYLSYAVVDGNSLSVDLVIPLYSSVNDFGVVSPSIDIWKPYKEYNVGDRVFYNGVIWVCKKKNNGHYDDDREIVVFDEESFTLFNTDYLRQKYDGRELSDFIRDRKNDYENVNNKVCGITDSKLTSLRRLSNYINDYDEYERPDDKNDWLYFYRQGMVMTMPSTVTNGIGNICKLMIDPLTNEVVVTEESATSENELAAYGNYIQEITCNAEERTITFTYYTDVHLKAESVNVEKYDDDGNRLYFWKNFSVDTDGTFKKFGIKYVETHNYEEGGELDQLVSGEIYITKTVNNSETREQVSFEDYVKGDYDKYKGVLTQKFEFYKENSKSYYTLVIDTKDVMISYFLTNFEADRKNIDELVYGDIKMEYGMPNGKLGWDTQQKTFNLYDIVRHDYYNGISYMPDKNIDVNITRGNSSVFEKYIRFGEVKTLEDMVEYNNSSFFIMSDNF